MILWLVSVLENQESWKIKFLGAWKRHGAISKIESCHIIFIL